MHRCALLPSGWALTDLQLLFAMHLSWHSNSSITVTVSIAWPSKAWSKRRKRSKFYWWGKLKRLTTRKDKGLLIYKFLPIWVSAETLAQKSVFAATNNIARRMLRTAKASWVSHEPAIESVVLYARVEQYKSLRSRNQVWRFRQVPLWICA